MAITSHDRWNLYPLEHAGEGSLDKKAKMEVPMRTRVRRRRLLALAVIAALGSVSLCVATAEAGHLDEFMKSKLGGGAVRSDNSSSNRSFSNMAAPKPDRIFAPITRNSNVGTESKAAGHVFSADSFNRRNTEGQITTPSNTLSPFKIHTNDRPTPNPSIGAGPIQQIKDRLSTNHSNGAGPIPQIKDKLSTNPSNGAVPLQQFKDKLSANPSIGAGPLQQLKDKLSANPSTGAGPLQQLKDKLSANPSTGAGPLQQLKDKLSANPSAGTGPLQQLKDKLGANPAVTDPFKDLKAKLNDKLAPFSATKPGMLPNDNVLGKLRALTGGGTDGTGPGTGNGSGTSSGPVFGCGCAPAPCLCKKADGSGIFFPAPTPTDPSPKSVPIPAGTGTFPATDPTTPVTPTIPVTPTGGGNASTGPVVIIPVPIFSGSNSVPGANDVPGADGFPVANGFPIANGFPGANGSGAGRRPVIVPANRESDDDDAGYRRRRYEDTDAGYTKRNYKVAPLPVPTIAPVAARTIPPAPPAPACLVKEYLQTGMVLFRDVCSKEWAVNSTTVPDQLPAKPGCLMKDHPQADVVLFKDVCTNEWAMNPPQQAEASPAPQTPRAQ